MAMREFFVDQLEAVRAFLDFPGPRLQATLHDGEMRPILLCALKGIEDDEDCPRYGACFPHRIGRSSTADMPHLENVG